MPGWNLREGAITEDRVSSDEYWSLFNYVFSDACRKTNTYKFGLIKAICDQIYNIVDSSLGFSLSYKQIFERFAENYWNLILKYGIRQMSYNGKSEFSKIESIILNASQCYDIPEGTPFTSVNAEDREKIIRAIACECKKCVIGALYNDFEGKLYAFSLRGEGIIISHGAYEFISKYKMEIEIINYYSWARFLEKINDEAVLTRVIEKLELSTPQRKDLSIYRDVLYKEFQEDRCFYCRKPLKNTIHVDHFIPWTFVKTDNLWNFVLACPKCNIAKKDKLMGPDYISRIDERNRALIEMAGNTSFVKKEFQCYYNGLIDRLWTYAKMNGLREK